MGLINNDSFEHKKATYNNTYIYIGPHEIRVRKNENDGLYIKGTYNIEGYYRIYSSKEDRDNNDMDGILQNNHINIKNLTEQEFLAKNVYNHVYDKLKTIYTNYTNC